MEPDSTSDDFSEDEKLKDLIRDALSLQIETQKRKRNKKNINTALIGTIEEFLSNFLILGYDFEGNPCVIKVSPTVEKNEALMSLLMRVFSKELRPGGGDYYEETF